MSRIRLVLPRQQRGRARLTRIARALWRDTSALWSEFHRPIIVFVVAVFGGGYLYGELLQYAGYEPLPYVDLPYIMLALMVIEAPMDIPPEPYLIAFWYIMPLIAIYVIGRGVVDFVRLFFDRGNRRNAWEEAVASTYRNHIIVVGIGHVGLRIVRTLSQMGFEVVVIALDLSEEVDNELSLLGAPAIVGDARVSLTLEKAGLSYAKALVVCTSDDYLNLEITMRARDLNPGVRIVVRMWDNRFAEQLKRFLNVEAVLSSSDLVAPVFAGVAVGAEITQTLTIKGVEYSIVRLEIRPNSPFDGLPIGTLQTQHQIDIVLHERNGSVEVHPAGDIIVHASDFLVMFAQHSKIVNLVQENYNP